MTEADLPHVFALGVQSKASWGYDSSAMEIFSRELCLTVSDLENFLDAQVALQQGELIGYFTLRPLSSGEAELEHLFVSPSWFRQGVGTLLINAAITAARDRGARKVKVLSDPNATEFYLHHGAQVVGDHQSSIAGRTIPILMLDITSSAS